MQVHNVGVKGNPIHPEPRPLQQTLQHRINYSHITTHSRDVLEQVFLRHWATNTPLIRHSYLNHSPAIWRMFCEIRWIDVDHIGMKSDENHKATLSLIREVAAQLREGVFPPLKI